MGVARLLISRQAAGGNWPDSTWADSLATAYSIIVLSPTIFELGPSAACSAVPPVAGTGDTVNFDGSLSVHNDPFGTIASYTWDFLDGSPAITNPAPNATVSHTFSALGTYNVVLTVTDQNGLTASSSCPVTVIDGNRPPIANAGGPYNFCAGSPMVLNASGSIDPDGDPLTLPVGPHQPAELHRRGRSDGAVQRDVAVIDARAGHVSDWPARDRQSRPLDVGVPEHQHSRGRQPAVLQHAAGADVARRT